MFHLHHNLQHYGPTPSKRKNIVLEQEIVKGFQLVLHRKREIIFLRDGFLFGGNFRLWKFKMRMMLSKHGLWKFVDGSATIPHDKDQNHGL